MKVDDITELSVSLGRRIRELRTAKGKTAAEVGAAIGVTQQQMSKFECGKNRLAASQLIGISRFLKIPPSKFFGSLLGE